MQQEIPTITRAYISILPKQPYYDWANEVFKDTTPMFAENMEATAYAISDDFAVKYVADVVKPYAAFIFEMELFGTCTDKDTWPTDRSWKVFNEWFSYHVGSMLWDLTPEVILEHNDY